MLKTISKEDFIHAIFNNTWLLIQLKDIKYDLPDPIHVTDILKLNVADEVKISAIVNTGIISDDIDKYYIVVSICKFLKKATNEATICLGKTFHMTKLPKEIENPFVSCNELTQM